MSAGVQASSFTVRPRAFARLSGLAASTTRRTWLDLDPHDPEQTEAAVAFVRAVAADERLREAVDVSSTSLGAVLDAVEAGRAMTHSQVRRAVLSTAKYLIRAATRATPFGLMSGIGVARLGDGDIGGPGEQLTWKRGVRPDPLWLERVIRRAEENPDLIRHLRVLPNSLCLVKGVRLVNPRPHGPASDDAPLTAREKSIRLTAAVRFVLDFAQSAPRVADVVEALVRKFPSRRPDQAEQLVVTLVREGFLVTDLRPSLASTDPLAHVQTSLPTDAGLNACVAAFREYRTTTVGKGRPQFRLLRDAVAAVGAADQPAHVDLRFEGEVKVPTAVARDIETFADILRRTCEPSSPDRLADYRDAFVERFGVGALVPVKLLLDPEFGLDVPAGYRHPSGWRSGAAPARSHSSHDRDDLLSAWVQEAMLAGETEIVLDDDRVERLRATVSAAPACEFELGLSVVAPSARALARGDYHLVPAGLGGTDLALASVGRFMYLFEDEMPAIREAAGGSDVDGPLRAELRYRPIQPGSVNLMSHVPVADAVIPIGVFEDPDRTDVVPLDDIAIGATTTRLYAFSLSRGRETDPVAYTRVAPDLGMDNVSRFLLEIGASRRRPALEWDWGRLHRHSYLPRVRYGRCILSLARWRIPDHLRDHRLSDTEWDEALQRWQTTWRVPDVVHAGRLDHRLELVLRHRLHRRILRAELAKPELYETYITEALCTAEEAGGWVGGRACEIVASVAPREPAATVAADHRHRRIHRPEDRHHVGGEWLYLKLYAGETRHNDLLTGPISETIESLPAGVDRWFFIRYRDPEPHLRLRIHGEAGELHGLLPSLCQVLSDLCRAGYLNRYVLDEYAPETGRYGSGELLAAAERVFCADSALTLGLLASAPRATADDAADVRAALNLIDMLLGVLGANAADWALEHLPAPRFTEEVRRARKDLRAVSSGDWDAAYVRVFNDPSIEDPWKRRRNALADYGVLLDDPASRDLPVQPAETVRSLLHMHFNRHFGMDSTAELRATGLARVGFEDVIRRGHRQSKRPDS